MFRFSTIKQLINIFECFASLGEEKKWRTRNLFRNKRAAMRKFWWINRQPMLSNHSFRFSYDFRTLATHVKAISLREHVIVKKKHVFLSFVNYSYHIFEIVVIAYILSNFSFTWPWTYHTIFDWKTLFVIKWNYEHVERKNHKQIDRIEWVFGEKVLAYCIQLMECY